MKTQSETILMSTSLNISLLDAAREAGCTKIQRKSRKPYWCSNLSQLRDRKRFWYHLWCQNGRPRSGVVYQCHKDLKRLYRKKARWNLDHIHEIRHRKMNYLFKEHNIRGFWNMVKKCRNSKVTSSLANSDLTHFYSSIMQDSCELSNEQLSIEEQVHKFYDRNSEFRSDITISSRTISDLIDKLKSGSAAGFDKITPEHLKYGKCSALCERLSSLYTHIIQHCVVPNIFTIGVIIPILKKAGLDPNEAGNYRPITISTVHSKIVESYLCPEVALSENQYGFQKNRGAAMPTTLTNDVIQHCKTDKTPLFLCSLDAEKCFDRIWHAGLFYKLMDKIPVENWLLFYRWYRELKAVVRWQGSYGQSFVVSRGTRQGSIVSPVFFNVFINDLLVSLSNEKHGLKIGPCTINTMAYADDITLLSTRIPDLQAMIDLCTTYAKEWRFTFSASKSQCAIFGDNPFKENIEFSLDGRELHCTDSIEILGITYHHSGVSSCHIAKRIQKCRRTAYTLSSSGMCYPGVQTKVKAHVWKTVCMPTLLYGTDNLSISNADISSLESAQGSIMKNWLGLSKRQRHTRLLNALGLPTIRHIMRESTKKLYNRLFQVDTPARRLNIHWLTKYLTTGRCTKESLLSRVLSMGCNPLDLMTRKPKTIHAPPCKDGVIDSLSYLLHSENFTKPWSLEYALVTLLTKAF